MSRSDVPGESVIKMKDEYNKYVNNDNNINKSHCF